MQDKPGLPEDGCVSALAALGRTDGSAGVPAAAAAGAGVSAQSPAGALVACQLGPVARVHYPPRLTSELVSDALA